LKLCYYSKIEFIIKLFSLIIEQFFIHDKINRSRKVKCKAEGEISNVKKN